MPSDETAKPASAPILQVDEARAAARGIRQLSGERLTLYTDLPADTEVGLLPEVVAQAFPQWCAYFGVDPARHAGWKLTGVLMKDKARFLDTGLLPASLPPFPHAFSWNDVCWVHEQASPYYRRHLLLHEGTHAFCHTILGGAGPPWYMEGMAELLGTHRWTNGRLELNVMPARKEETPMWGRIKIIKDEIAAGRGWNLEAVLAYRPTPQFETEPYAWCWAATFLLDHEPRFQARFRQLARLVRNADFNRRFRESIGADWPLLLEEWQLFVHDLEYGYDVARTALDLAPGKPLPAQGATISVVADRGWQNSGIRLEAGVSYRLRASGRYQVGNQPQVWWCEPGGVSIRYYKGLPLGVLLAALRPDPATEGAPSCFLRPSVLGLDGRLTPQQSCTLFLKINDSAAELADNAGKLSVEVCREGAANP
jgi:hypothetical protein